MGQCQSLCSPDNNQERSSMEQSIRISYDGEKFLIPDHLIFDKQATFSKVEQAAKSFCEKNQISLFYTPLLARIIAYRHEFIFQEIWKNIQVEDREDFLQDLNNVQHDLMDSFYYNFVKRVLKDKKVTLKRLKISEPRVIKDGQITLEEHASLKSYGQHLIRENKVAVILMCAGSSSRFDGQDKFLQPLNLTEKVNMLDIIFKRLRKNVGKKLDLPIIINCNQQNIDKIQLHLKYKKYYGFSAQKIKYFNTVRLPIFDKNGKYCLNSKMRLIRRPSGTASCIQFLLSQNFSNFLNSQGIEYICVSGLQNLMQNPCDPVFLGMMKVEDRKVGAKCVGQLFQGQKLPRYVKNQISRKMELLNPQDIEMVQPKEILMKLPVAINSMVFELKSLVNIIADYNNSLFLAERYHVIQKIEKVYNFRFFQTEARQCYSFQKDMRDVISCVDDPILYKVNRTREYAPIITKNNSYSISEAMNYYRPKLEQELNESLIKL